MRLIDADKLKPDCLTKGGSFAISQSQIANAPTVEERKQGEWIRIDDEKVKCPFCEVVHLMYSYPRTTANFCPSCGTKVKID